MNGMHRRSITAVLAGLLIVTFGAACAPTVAFQQTQPGKLGLVREIGLSVGKNAFDVNLEITDKKETAAVRNKNAVAQGEATDAAVFGPVVERELLGRLTANPAVPSAGRITHTIDVAGVLFVRDTVKVKKEEVKLENRILDVKETSVVDRLHDLTLNYAVRAGDGRQAVWSGKQSAIRTESGSGRTEQDARERFEPWEQVAEQLIAKAAGKIIDDILPRTEKVKRTLRNGESKQLRESVAVAAEQGLDRAWPRWKELLDRQETLGPKDRAALLHNAGVYYESVDDLDNARSAFESCVALSQDEWCREGMTRMKTRAEALGNSR